MRKLGILFSLTFLAACGGATATKEAETTGAVGSIDRFGDGKTASEVPASGPARDVKFPWIVPATLADGLTINTISARQLPVVYMELQFRSGSETDPKDLPGLSSLTAQMLTEGTKTRSSAALAEEVDFLGASIGAGSGNDSTSVSVRALSEHLDQAMTILADVALNPAFKGDELAKLKKREEARLTMMENNPRALASREFYKLLYGDHPYGTVDTNKEALKKVTTQSLRAWHKKYFVPNNAVLIVVGDVDPAVVKATAEKVFAKWKAGTVDKVVFPTPPTQTARTITVVDRPNSEQSVIYVGNLAMPRNGADYIPFQVANQVLGGSASSRLFMDLREKRSLTYGAYSNLNELADTGPFIARASVRNAVTKEAVGAFFEHLDRIVKEPAPEAELSDAKRFLTDSFPLQIDTAARITGMLAELREYGLPDDYWDHYRSDIMKVTAAQAFDAAKKYIHPDTAVVVVVGDAKAVVEPLRTFGAVNVVDRQGKPVAKYEAVGAAPAAAPAAPAASKK